MKKIFLLLAVFACVSFASNAQDRFVGLRLGFGAEASYLHPMGDANRFEFDLGLFNHGLDANVIYDWTFELEDNFSWYVGAGGTVGLRTNIVTVNTYDVPVGTTRTYDAALGAVGNIGLEYNFEDIPLQLTVDCRPTIYFYSPSTDYWGGMVGGMVGVSGRYRF